jgi:hypothetical protein
MMKYGREYRAQKRDSSVAEYAATLACREHRILDMMENHRHENQVNGVVRQRYRLGATEFVSHAAVTLFSSRLVQHLCGRIEADHFRIEMIGESFGEAPGAATQIEDGIDGLFPGVC